MKRATLLLIVALIVVLGAALLAIQMRNNTDTVYRYEIRTLEYQVDVDVTNHYATRYAEARQTAQR